MIDKMLLYKICKSNGFGDILMKKMKKNNKLFGDKFMKEAKKDSKFNK